MVAAVAPRISSRPFHDEADFWRIRNFLIETYSTTPLGFNWEVRRWDGWRFRHESAALKPAWHDQVYLWEDADDRLIGVAHPEGEGDLHLEVHPDYRSLEPQMIAWGEYNLETYVDHERHLETFVYDDDVTRQSILKRRGYEMLPYGGVTRRLHMDMLDMTPVSAPEGYIIRCTRSTPDDFQRMADVLNAGFNRTIHTAEEYRILATRSPSFRHLLNLVAEAPDGSFVAHVGVSYEHVNHYAVLEPVCTHPAHRRKGLARALILEGMQRVKILGATEALLGTGDDVGANRLYEAVGFSEVHHGNIWRKVW